jgi:transcriptional regulator with XRE-family HTH domain
MILRDQEATMISGAQLRAARALVGLSQAEVAAKSSVSIPTIKRAEAEGALKVAADTREAIAAVLRKAGVIFVEENGDGPGVRLRKGK